MLENKSEYLISGEFAELLEAIDVFGFYLASIDMRQDSSVHEACVAELLKSAGLMIIIQIYQRTKSVRFS